MFRNLSRVLSGRQRQGNRTRYQASRLLYRRCNGSTTAGSTGCKNYTGFFKIWIRRISGVRGPKPPSPHSSNPAPSRRLFSRRDLYRAAGMMLPRQTVKNVEGQRMLRDREGSGDAVRAACTRRGITAGGGPQTMAHGWRSRACRGNPITD